MVVGPLAQGPAGRHAGNVHRDQAQVICGIRQAQIDGLASGAGSYAWNIGASRLGVAVASLWVNLVPFCAVLWSMAYGFMPNLYQLTGGLVALSGVVYMQWRKLRILERERRPT